MRNHKVSCCSKTLFIVALVASSCLSIGCANRGGILGVDCCADVPAGAIPEPAGTKVCNWQTEQVVAAIADRTVLYQADFIARTESLSPSALDHMSRSAQSNFASMQSWVVQPSGDEALDARRVSMVNRELSRRGVTPVEVVLATPAALGLRGPQAEQAARGIGSSRSTSTGNSRTSRASSAGRNLPGGIF